MSEYINNIILPYQSYYVTKDGSTMITHLVSKKTSSSLIIQFFNREDLIIEIATINLVINVFTNNGVSHIEFKCDEISIILISKNILPKKVAEKYIKMLVI